MRCAEVQEMIPAYVGGSEASLSYRRHIGRCPDCSRELARYDDLIGELADMRMAQIEPPPGLRRSLIGIPSMPGRRASVAAHVARNRRVYAGGVALALVGVAGTAAWRNRSRRVATA